MTPEQEVAAKAKKHDPEETREETAARRIDSGSVLFANRAERFVTTLRVNARSLSPYKRQLTAAWLKRYCERLQSTLEERDSIPPLSLDSLPDLED